MVSLKDIRGTIDGFMEGCHGGNSEEVHLELLVLSMDSSNSRGHCHQKMPAGNKKLQLLALYQFGLDHDVHFRKFGSTSGHDFFNSLISLF